jgi:signal transduction histidine kinase
MTTKLVWLNRTWWNHWLERKIVHWSLRLVFATTITILLSQIKLDPLEFILYDWRAAVANAPAASGDVVIVGIDDKTIGDLKRNPTARDLSLVLEKLSTAKPRFLVSMARPTEFLGGSAELTQLANTAKATGFIYAENDLPGPGQTKLESLPPPFNAIRVESAPITHDHSMFDSHGVTRRLILNYQDTPTLPFNLAKTYNGRTAFADYHGVFRSQNADQSYVRFKRDFLTLSFSDVLSGRFDPGILRDRVILIGRDSTNLGYTFIGTPSSDRHSPKSLLEIQANYIDNLITNSSPILTPPLITAALTFLLSILTMWMVMRVRPSSGLIGLVFSVAGVGALSLTLDLMFNLFFPIASPIFGIIACYYFVLPYRLILENRKSWEYFEKNRLLTQVEELKSNFIRLMSHDLKTPIARIQAMAEIIDQENSVLSNAQKQALDTITASSEELSQFIASILNLSRIQSKKVKLQLQTRDITQLLQKVLRNSEHSARRKNITFVTEFEPLFSVKMDEDLMRQVFSNLVENAVKYSPENTQVKISAKEVDGQIKIQIADQGIGIPQAELPFVFEKFYRAQNAEYENSGTGLGLYLARYFVQLHKGHIHVKSEANNGSVFSVDLPLDMEDMDTEGAANV